MKRIKHVIAIMLFSLAYNFTTLAGVAAANKTKADANSILFLNYSIVSGVFHAQVEYTAQDSGYVYVYLGTQSWSKLADDSVFVTPGTDLVDFEMTPNTPFTEGDTYNICTDLKNLADETIITDCETVVAPVPSIKFSYYFIDIQDSVLNVKVDYQATQDGYVSVFLGDQSWNTIERDSVFVQAGFGQVSSTIGPISVFNDSSIYNICADLKDMKSKTITTDCQTTQVPKPSIKLAKYDINMVDSALNVLVDYVATDDSYINIFLGDISWGYLGYDSIYVAKGMGQVSSTVTPIKPFEGGSSYNVCADLKDLDGNTIITDCEVADVYKPSITMTDYTIDLANGVLNVTVDYEAQIEGYVSLFLGDMTWGYLGMDTVHVTSGKGEVTLQVTPDQPFTEGTSYNVCADLKNNQDETIITDCEVAVATGINDRFNNELNVSVYPNPVKDILNVQVADENDVDIKLIDLNGRVVFEATDIKKNLTIPVESFNKGIYILSVTNSTKVLNIKTVVE